MQIFKGSAGQLLTYLEYSYPYSTRGFNRQT